MAEQSCLPARNPEGDSKLPNLVNLPIEGSLVLKARDTCPGTIIDQHAAGGENVVLSTAVDVTVCLPDRA
jgi:hypothetical protein